MDVSQTKYHSARAKTFPPWWSVGRYDVNSITGRGRVIAGGIRAQVSDYVRSQSDAFVAHERFFVFEKYIISFPFSFR